LTEPQTGRTTHKFAVVLNKKIEPGTALNACAHMTATLVARADSETRKHMSFVEYLDADSNIHPVSALSLVVLRARNSNQVGTARIEAIKAGLPYADFTESITKDSFVEQMDRTRALREEDLDYWGICIFGLKEVVDPITRKFSLWRI
jgi:Protein of unknown function (DUF2000)